VASNDAYTATGDEKEFMNQKKMMMVDAYIAKNHLPEDLGQRIRKYFVFQISKSRSMSGSAMQELSPPMFRKVMYFLYHETVSSSPVFANVNPDVLGECVLCIGQQWFMPAEVRPKPCSSHISIRHVSLLGHCSGGNR
jgi:hypothetical protein